MEGATVAGLLADEPRRRVFAAVALGAETIHDVAETAGLDVATVQAALPRLVTAGVVEQRNGLRVNDDALRAAARQRPPRERELEGATPEQARVLRNFVDEGRLTSLPAKASQRRVLLEYFADRFDRGREYSEREVNELLARFHPDHAALRRYLVDDGLLARERGGVYHRP